jgi:hypothetical protein
MSFPYSSEWYVRKDARQTLQSTLCCLIEKQQFMNNILKKNIKKEADILCQLLSLYFYPSYPLAANKWINYYDRFIVSSSYKMGVTLRLGCLRIKEL